MHGTFTHEDGRTLTVTRQVAASPDIAWQWLTESAKTAAWYGPWRGNGAVGQTIQVTMAQEEGAPETGMRIEACERPRRLTLVADNPPPYAFPIDLILDQTEAGTTVALRHRQIPQDLALKDLGPGWEYYLDRLVGAIEGYEPKSFEACVAAYAEGYASLEDGPISG